MVDDTLWTYEDVAAYLRCSWKTVRRWSGEGKIPTVKVGTLNRFDPAAIRQWVADGGVTDGAK